MSAYVQIADQFEHFQLGKHERWLVDHLDDMFITYSIKHSNQFDPAQNRTGTAAQRLWNRVRDFSRSTTAVWAANLVLVIVSIKLLVVALLTYDYQRHLTAYKMYGPCRLNFTDCPQPPQRMVSTLVILYKIQVPCLFIPGVGILTMSLSSYGGLILHLGTKLVCRCCRIDSRSDQINFLLNPREELRTMADLRVTAIERLKLEVRSAASGQLSAPRFNSWLSMQYPYRKAMKAGFNSYISETLWSEESVQWPEIISPRWYRLISKISFWTYKSLSFSTYILWIFLWASWTYQDIVHRVETNLSTGSAWPDRFLTDSEQPEPRLHNASSNSIVVEATTYLTWRRSLMLAEWLIVGLLACKHLSNINMVLVMLSATSAVWLKQISSQIDQYLRSGRVGRACEHRCSLLEALLNYDLFRLRCKQSSFLEGLFLHEVILYDAFALAICYLIAQSLSASSMWLVMINCIAMMSMSNVGLFVCSYKHQQSTTLTRKLGYLEAHLTADVTEQSSSDPILLCILYLWQRRIIYSQLSDDLLAVNVLGQPVTYRLMLRTNAYCIAIILLMFQKLQDQNST